MARHVGHLVLQDEARCATRGTPTSAARLPSQGWESCAHAILPAGTGFSGSRGGLTATSRRPLSDGNAGLCPRCASRLQTPRAVMAGPRVDPEAVGEDGRAGPKHMPLLRPGEWSGLAPGAAQTRLTETVARPAAGFPCEAVCIRRSHQLPLSHSRSQVLLGNLPRPLSKA